MDKGGLSAKELMQSKLEQVSGLAALYADLTQREFADGAISEIGALATAIDDGDAEEIKMALKGYFERIGYTVSLGYGKLGGKHQEEAQSYIKKTVRALAVVAEVCKELGLEKEFLDLLFLNGNSSNTVTSYGAYLEELYKVYLRQSIVPIPASVIPVAPECTVESSDQSAAAAKRDTLRLFEAAIRPTETTLGLGEIEREHFRTQGAAHPVEIPENPPIKAETFAGLGVAFDQLRSGDESKGNTTVDGASLQGPRSDNPQKMPSERPAALPSESPGEIPADDPKKISHPSGPDAESILNGLDPDETNPALPNLVQIAAAQAAAFMLSKKTATTTPVSEAATEVPPCPPAPAPLPPSELLDVAPFTTEGNPAMGLPVYTKENPAAQPDNDNLQPLYAPFTAEGNAALGLPVINGSNIPPKEEPLPLPEGQYRLPSSFTPTSVKGASSTEGESKPAEETPYAPFTTEGNAALGLPVINGSNLPPKQEPLPLPEGQYRLPSSFAPESIKTVAEKPQEKPDNQGPNLLKKQIRAKIAAWSFAALGLLGIGLTAYKMTGKSAENTDTTTSPTATASVSSSLAKAAAAPQEKQAEQKKVYEKGVYKVNKDHQAFKAYLHSIRDATDLVGKIKDIASQTKLDYYQDPAELDAAKKQGIKALNGHDTPLERRIAVMEAFLDQALKQPIDNAWVKGFFQNHREGLANFKKTGKWDAKALSKGVDKFFDAFQEPVKLTQSPGVIGFAPDINPETNPDILRMKSFAPTYYDHFVKAGQQMQRETDPKKIVPYNDFNSIKAATCAKILEIAGKDPNPDVQSGIKYMDRAWCKGSSGPYNYLNAALQRTVPVTGDIGTDVNTAPANTPTAPDLPKVQPRPKAPEVFHNSIAPNGGINQAIENYLNLEQPRPVIPKPVQQPSSSPAQKNAPSPQGSNLISRTFSRMKSFLGITSGSQSPTQKQPSIPAQQQPEFTQKDIPMYSLKENIQNYFWG